MHLILKQRCRCCVDLLNSQTESIFSKNHCALVLQSNLNLPFLETILCHVEELLTEIFKGKQHSEGQRWLMLDFDIKGRGIKVMIDFSNFMSGRCFP